MRHHLGMDFPERNPISKHAEREERQPWTLERAHSMLHKGREFLGIVVDFSLAHLDPRVTAAHTELNTSAASGNREANDDHDQIDFAPAA